MDKQEYIPKKEFEMKLQDSIEKIKEALQQNEYRNALIVLKLAEKQIVDAIAIADRQFKLGNFDKNKDEI